MSDQERERVIQAVQEALPGATVVPLRSEDVPDFVNWMLGQHLALCARKGVDCKACTEAKTRGLVPGGVQA